MMNRTWKSVLSVLLAAALLLPVAPVARAAGEDGGTADADGAVLTAEAAATYATESNVTTPTNTSLTLTASKGTVYYRNQSHPGEITVTATGFPEAFSGTVKWMPSDNDLLSVEPTETAVTGGTASVKVKANHDPGSTGKTVTLTATATPGGPSGSISILVMPDKVNTSGIAFSPSTLSMQVNDTKTVSLSPAPVYPSGDGTPSVKYYSSNTSVATVGETSGQVQGIAPGQAKITATIDGEELVNREVVVSVNSPSTELTGSATLGSNFSMQPIYTGLVSAFSKSYPGKTPTSISFTSLGTVNGTLYATAGVPATAAAGGASNSYNLSQLLNMFLAPSSEGVFQCEAKVADSSGSSLTATIKITVSLPSHTIYIPISGSANYSFATASADTSGKTGVQLIRDAVGTFGSIQFGAIPSESGSVGTLYTSSRLSNENLVSPYGGTIVPATSISELYFIPTRQGTYTVPFTVWSGENAAGTRLSTGTLILPVDGSSLDVSITLGSVAPYVFSSTPASGTSSLYFQMLAAINNAVGSSSWGGIRFDGAASASSTGSLRQSNSYSYAISASTYIEKSSISMLYYVPDRTGTYTITYGVYSDGNSNKAIATGTLTIKTSTIPTGVPDIVYAALVKNSVTLSEDDFISFFQNKNGSKYQLSFVVFNEYDGDGTFYHGSNSFQPYNSADFYTSTYTGSVSASARYLKNLNFTAPSAAGYTAVRFTCYGGTTSNDTSIKTEGKLCIYYTAGDVPTVSYNVFGVASVDLKDADFVPAYNAAMKSSVSRPEFTIQFLNGPSKGTLYYYYSGNNRTTLTSSNVKSYNFSVSSKVGVSLEQLTYVPGRSGSGTDTITYLATSASGTVLYVGTLQFKLSSDLTLNVTNDGSNFQLANFYSASDSDPVLYVTFPQPSAGKVYVQAGSRYIPVSETTKLYTISSSNGQYPITSAFYAPRANEIGTVTLKYTAHRNSGATDDNIITLNILNKLSSGTFGDVGGVFDWAANSIDFASKMGLVNGTNTNVNPPLFSPANTMRRCDFVLMLYRHAGSPAVSGSTTFPDVPSGKYYYSSAVWAYNNNIMRNVTVNGMYNPEGDLTRQDFAQILFNFAVAMGENTANNGSIRSYTDASSVSSNTLEGVTWAVAKGYITSAVTGALYIQPTRSATRAEISTLLHRYLTY